MATTDNIGTSTQGLAPWSSQFVTDTLALGKAAATEPIENTMYGGPLTAGASDIQNKVFQGIGGLSFPTNLGGSFTSTGAPAAPQVTGTGLSTGTTGGGSGISGLSSTPGSDTGGGITSAYMNPYLQNVLNPQLQSLRQNAQSNLNAQMGKLTSQGAYGGGRQAIITNAANRDLLQELNKTVGTGYATAFDKGRDQFNTEQQQGINLGKFMADQGAAQRGIESEGVAADLKEFERQRDYYKNNAKYMRDLIGPGTLPITETTNAPAQLSGLASLIGALGGVSELTDLIGELGDNLSLGDFLGNLGFDI
jgi:hypothetical protein